MQNRLTSKVVWAAIAASVISVLLALGVITTGQGETIDAVVAAVLQAFTAFGILNNPTDKAGF